MKTELSWTSLRNSVHKQTHRLSTCDLRAPPSTPGSLLWDLPKVGSEKVIETGGSEPLSIHSLPPPFTTTRGGAVQAPVPVGWREFSGEPWCSVCRWNPLRVGQSTSIWLHSCLLERHVSGRVQPRAPGNRFHVPPVDRCCSSLFSCLAATARCILGK